MFKIIILLFGLAIYGAYTLIDKLSANVPSPVPDKPSLAQSMDKVSNDTNLLSAVADSVGNWALTSTAEAAGLLLLEATPAICDESTTVTVESLDLFSQSLPPAAQALLGDLQATANKTPVRSYTGDLGLGVCFPSLGKAAVWPIQLKS